MIAIRPVRKQISLFFYLFFLLLSGGEEGKKLSRKVKIAIVANRSFVQGSSRNMLLYAALIYVRIGQSRVNI